MRDIRQSRRGAVSLLTGATVSVVLGQWWLRDGPSLGALVVWLAGLAMIVWLQWPTMPEVSTPPEPSRLERTTLVQRVLLGVAALEAIAVVLLLRDLEPTADRTFVVAAWLLSMVALLMAARSGRTSSDRDRPMPLRSWPVWERWAFAGILLLALAVRSVRLGRYPWPVDGDGAAFALLARAVRQGVLRDPFTTGYSDHGTLFAFLQAGGMQVFGDTVAGAAAINVAFGTATVAVVYLLVRRLMGTPPALVAAVLLAVFHFHLYLSRVALDNAPDAFAMVAALYFLDVAFVEARRVHAVLAGLTLGLAPYGYTGSRILIPITAAIIVFLTIHQRRRVGAVGTSIHLAGWLLAGAVLAFLPLGLHYLQEPWDLQSRSNQVSIWGGWLETEADRTDAGVAAVLGRQARDAALLPFATEPSGHYRPGIPLVGFPVAVPAAIGLAVATAGMRRRRHAGLVIAWWTTLAGVGMTVGLSSQRWSSGVPLVAIAAAVGIDAVVRVARSLVPTRASATRIVGALAACAIAVVAVWNLGFYFRERNVLRHYGDVNTLVAAEVGLELQSAPTGTTAYMAAAPRMSYRSHNSIELMAPHVVGIDLLEPLVDQSQVPTLDGPAIFVFLPERVVEMDVVRAAVPGGVVEEVRWRDGQLLFTTYRIGLGP